MKPQLAHSAVLEWRKGITIDGIPFPFAVGTDVTVTHDYGLTTVTLPLIVDGPVTITDWNGTRATIDPELGHVGEWARALVRNGLLDALPWLDDPQDATAGLSEGARG